MEVPEVILYMDYNMTLACYPWSLLIYYLLTLYTLYLTLTKELIGDSIGGKYI